MNKKAFDQINGYHVSEWSSEYYPQTRSSCCPWPVLCQRDHWTTTLTRKWISNSFPSQRVWPFHWSRCRSSWRLSWAAPPNSYQASRGDWSGIWIWFEPKYLRSRTAWEKLSWFFIELNYVFKKMWESMYINWWDSLQLKACKSTPGAFGLAPTPTRA